MALKPDEHVGAIAESAVAPRWSPPRWPALAVLALGLAGAIAILTWQLLPGALVESEPSGAVVLVDGKHVGSTPLLLSALLPGDRQVRVEAPGHAPWSGTAPIAPGASGRVLAVLAPLPGQLSVDTAPAAARVVIDGVDLGLAPVTATALAAGPHRVAVSAEDHHDREEEVRIPPGGAVARSIVLRPFAAHLTLMAHVQGPVVFVDDRERGVGSEALEVEPGEHQLRIEAEGHRPWRGVIQLRPNETRILDITLQRVWPDVETGDLVYPIAVIVENQDQARPQAGLDQADVVYEALAEGGITRFLAVYATHDPEVVGPVRSARHYFVHRVREFSAPLIHIGASPQGYAALRAAGVTSMEGGQGSAVFWRSRDRRAPHNAYTSIAATRAKLSGAAVKPGPFGGLAFREGDFRLTGSPAPIATVKYGPWRYTVTWSYDPDANGYVRGMDGAPHLDATSGQQIRAANVLFQWIPVRPIAGDGAGRLDFADVGSGSLLALLDGVAIEGTWSKASLAAPTAYQDREGRPLRLNAGPTWIHVLPLNGRVDW